jgi:hypothetical protein
MICVRLRLILSVRQIGHLLTTRDWF